MKTKPLLPRGRTAVIDHTEQGWFLSLLEQRCNLLHLLPKAVGFCYAKRGQRIWLKTSNLMQFFASRKSKRISSLRLLFSTQTGNSTFPMPTQVLKMGTTSRPRSKKSSNAASRLAPEKITCLGTICFSQLLRNFFFRKNYRRRIQDMAKRNNQVD